MQDPLKSLFEESDVAPPPAATGAPELATQVRRLHGQRQRRGRVIAASAAILAGILVWQGASHLANDTTSKSVPVAARDAGATTVDLPQLAAQLNVEQRIVERLLVAERRNRVAGMAAKNSLTLARRSDVAEQIGRASMALLLAADEIRSRPQLRSVAERDYQFVIARFPGTEWADAAKQRLADLRD